MASVSSDAKGYRRLHFLFGHRRTIHLGPIPIKTAREIKTRVEAILAAVQAALPMDGLSAQWLQRIDDDLHSKLSKIGLIPERPKRGSTDLGTMIDELHARLTKGWKPGTRLNHRIARKRMVKFFGEARDVLTVTEADAEAFREHLGTFLKENTVRRWCGYARQYFLAFSKKLKIENPFGNMKRISVEAVPERLFYCDEHLARRVLAAMPTVEWKLIFALCRWGGFRCPSEHNALRWRDIDWRRKRITLQAPKTGERTLPLFPELETLLQAMPRAGDRVFPDHHTNINLRKVFIDHLKAAGIPPWPKIFQNLRSTRETELLERFPLQVVCSWIGNTEAVARKHYLQTTDEHFNRATTLKATQNAAEGPESRGIVFPAVATFRRECVDFRPVLVGSDHRILPARFEKPPILSVYHKYSMKPTHRATQTEKRRGIPRRSR